ncbi:MAG: DUF4157 domain-containing protein [Calothrix sp. FI2-JRJ7]|jgi:hypothetical protein|nr:DUF4157 domain-containing protein [Calothrix sp. FI2-JRJ7]
MRDTVRVSRKKIGLSNTTNPSLVSSNTPTVASPIRSFTPSAIQTVPELSSQTQSTGEQVLEPEALKQRPLGHDISRISLRPQAKLTVGTRGDKYEQEADAMASRVMSMSDSAVQRMVPQQTDEEVQTKQDAAAITPLVQREAASEEEEIQSLPLLQRATDGSFQAGGNIETQLNNSKGGGTPLSDEVRGFMEPRFGADFSGVRVHTSGDAVQMNRELGAQAFTHGSNVYFGAGKAPGNNELTAHELTHVVQQTGGVERQSIPNNSSHIAKNRKEPSIVQMTKVQLSSPSQTLVDVIQCDDDPNLNPVDAGRDVAAGTGTVMEVEAILRNLYQQADAAIAQEGAFMLEKGVPEEEVARWVIDARNQAKVKIRAWDLDVLRIMAERSNVRKYGDPVGPSYEQLRHGDPAHNIKPRTDIEIIEGAKKTRPSVNRWVGRLRIAGRIMIAIDIGIAAYKVASAPEVDRPRVLFQEIGGLAGAAAGGWAGAKLGGMIGGGIGAWFGGAGAAPGAAIGALVGGIGGGLLGRKGGDLVADQLYPPKETAFEGGFQ